MKKKVYPQSFKDEVVRYYQTNHTIAETIGKYGIAESTLLEWCMLYEEWYHRVRCLKSLGGRMIKDKLIWVGNLYYICQSWRNILNFLRNLLTKEYICDILSIKEPQLLLFLFKFHEVFMKRMNEDKLNQMAEFIYRYIKDNNGESPKFKDILEYMGMSNSVGYRYLTTLRDRGVIEYNGKDTLSIKGQESMKAAFRRIAIVGSIVCGPPEDNRQEIQGYVAIPEEWVDGDCYLLRASGDSMIDIGIDDGDFVLIKRAQEAYDGQVVAALTDDGTTLKRFIKHENGRPWLLAENKAYSKERRELNPSKIEIQGIVLKVIKDIK